MVKRKSKMERENGNYIRGCAEEKQFSFFGGEEGSWNTTELK
jgi:hypothetical protein